MLGHFLSSLRNKTRPGRSQVRGPLEHVGAFGDQPLRLSRGEGSRGWLGGRVDQLAHFRGWIPLLLPSFREIVSAEQEHEQQRR